MRGTKGNTAILFRVTPSAVAQLSRRYWIEEIDLESKRKVFFFYGLIVSLTLVLLAFKSRKEVSEVYIPAPPEAVPIDVIDIPSTSEPEEYIAPPPVLKIFDKIIIAEKNYQGPEHDIGVDQLEDPIPLPLPDDKAEKSEGPLIIAQFMPEFPGGNKNLNKWLSTNLVYPEKAHNLGLKGRVYLRFVVGKDGSISNAEVTRGVDPILDQEALRVIKEMPKWKPGMQNGQLVSVSYNLYVSFKLN